MPDRGAGEIMMLLVALLAALAFFVWAMWPPHQLVTPNCNLEHVDCKWPRQLDRSKTSYGGTISNGKVIVGC